MAQMKGGISPRWLMCSGGSAIDAGNPSSPVITETAILTASDQTEGTGVTSVKVRVRHGINEGRENMSGQWPRGGAMNGMI